MKHRLTRTALTASLTLTLGLAAAPLAVAQDAAAVDEQVATTPTALTNLLGPDGLDAVESDFYLNMQMNAPGPAEGGPGLEDSLMHWRSETEDGRLVFTMRMSDLRGGGNTERYVFTEAGEFLERSRSTFAPGYQSSDTAVREGDEVRTRTQFSIDGEPSESEEETHPYAPMTDTIPSAWMQLAFAYHLREEHEQFVIRMSDDVIGEMSFVQVFHAEDIGTETVEIAGEAYEAHVLLLTVSTEMDGEPLDGGVDDEQTMQMYVLADGSIVRMRAEFDGMTMSADAITAEEAEAMRVDGGGGQGVPNDAPVELPE